MFKKISLNLLVLVTGISLIPTALAMHNPCNGIIGDWAGKATIFLYNGATCKYQTTANVYHDYNAGLVATVTVDGLDNDDACPNYTSDYASVYCSGNWMQLKSYVIDVSGTINHKGTKATNVGHVYAGDFGYSASKLTLKKVDSEEE